MKGTFIVRLLDAEDRLLAWTRVIAVAQAGEMQPACPFKPTSDTLFTIEQDGRATKITIHWVELDIARMRTVISGMDVKVGQVVNFTWMEPIWTVQGSPEPVPLPTYVEREPIVIGVGTANMNARTS